MNRVNFRLVHTGLWLLACPWLLFPAISLSLTVMAIGVLLSGRVVARRWQGYWIRPTAIDILLASYVLFNLLSWLTSPLPDIGLSKLTVIILGWAAYYLIQDWLEVPAGLNQLTTLHTWLGLGLVGVGLFTVEWPMTQQVIPFTPVYRLLPHLSGAFIVHRNEFAAIMLLCLPFAWAFWRQQKRYWAILPLFIIAFALLLTQSRTAFVACLAMIGAGLVWGRLHWYWLLGGLLVAVGLFIGLLDNPQLMMAVDTASKSDGPTSWAARLEIWQAGVSSLPDYPVVGSGLYTFSTVSRLNFFYRFIASDFDISHAHNLFLQEGLNSGWAGMLLAFELWGAVLALLWLAAGRQQQPEAVLFGAALTGYLAFNLIDVLSPGHRPGLLVWFVLAGGMAVIRFGPRPGLAWYWQVAPVGLLAALSLTPLLPYNLATIQLDRVRLGLGQIEPPLTVENLRDDAARLGWLAYLAGQPETAAAYWQQDGQVPAFFQERGFQFHRQQDFEAALADYDFILQLDPTNGLVHYWHGLIDLQYGRSEKALAHFEQAIQHSASLGGETLAAVYYNQGRLLVKQRNYPAGVAALQQAVTLDDSRAIYYEWLGKGLEGLGDPAGAAAAYQQAHQLETP